MAVPVVPWLPQVLEGQGSVALPARRAAAQLAVGYLGHAEVRGPGMVCP